MKQTPLYVKIAAVIVIVVAVFWLLPRILWYITAIPQMIMNPNSYLFQISVIFLILILILLLIFIILKKRKR